MKKENSDGEGTSLILLTYDEIEAMQKLYPLIPLDEVDEVFCVDGGSTDGTIEFFEDKGIPVIVQDADRKGRGRAFLMGMEHAKYENLIFFSGDGNEDPRDIPRMKKHLEEGYDLVIAGRFILEGSDSDDSDDPLLIRRYGNILCSKIADILWHTGVHDSINGFRAMKKTAMRRMNLDAPKHEIEIQSTVRAAKLGLRIKEFPSKELLRMGGERKPTAGTWELAKNFLFFFLHELWLGKRFMKPP